jgi:hypothetical protein
VDFIFWGIVLIPVAISLFCKFALRWDISWLEWGAQVVIGLACLSMIWAMGRYSAASDVEIVNGAVISKNAWRFSCPEDTSNPCRNSYQCHPYEVCTSSTDSKGNTTQSCTTHYHTCYDYPWEQNWYVNNNMPVNQSIEIDRVDRQGAVEPPRYTQARIGDPTSAQHGYKNWVKASVGTLYSQDKRSNETYAALIPGYPLKVYDYYNVDRVITPTKLKLANEDAWNYELAKAVSTLGPQKQMNLVVVIAEGVGRDYAYGLRRGWEGFKKNDAVIVIGTRNGAIEWAEVMSWSKNKLFEVELRNAISVDMQGQAINSVDPAQFFAKVRDVGMRNFERRPMAEFEYLKGSIPPPAWLSWVCAIVAIVLGIGTSYVFNRVDLDAALFSRLRGNRFNNRYRF